MDGTRPRVLFSFGRPHARTNPYVVLLLRHLPARVEVRYYSARTALFEPYDVLHVHWPEAFLRAPSRSRRMIRRLVALALLAKLRLARVAVVSTIHNDLPHDPGGVFERFFLRRLAGLTSLWIRLNPATKERQPRTELIPIGTFRDCYTFDPTQPARPGTYLYFGLLRRYKGVPELLRAFADLDPAEHRQVDVIGVCRDPVLEAEIRDLAGRDRRVWLRLEHLDEAELAAAIRGAEVVVLPFHRVENTSSALTALALGRPVVLPRTPTTESLREEFGPAWVSLYDPPVTPAALEAALRALRGAASLRQGTLPPMVGRDWGAIGERHADLYQQLAARRGRRAR